MRIAKLVSFLATAALVGCSGSDGVGTEGAAREAESLAVVTPVMGTNEMIVPGVAPFEIEAVRMPAPPPRSVVRPPPPEVTVTAPSGPWESVILDDIRDGTVVPSVTIHLDAANVPTPESLTFTDVAFKNLQTERTNTTLTATLTFVYRSVTRTRDGS